MVSEESTAQLQVFKLIQEKERIEMEINLEGMVLRNNNVGFHDALVDKEGFPRNDIDVRSICHSRNKIICLQNDLKIVMKAIEEGIGKYFAERKSTDIIDPLQQKLPVYIESSDNLKPFLRVNLVSENSPGYVAGIMVHDLIISFGSINSTNYKDLNQVKELVKDSQNQSVKMRVKRNENIIEIILIPKVWNGQGLLGFKVASIA